MDTTLMMTVGVLLVVVVGLVVVLLRRGRVHRPYDPKAAHRAERYDGYGRPGDGVGHSR